MSFLEHIETQKKLGNISKKDALDMKMNYMTLNKDEKNQIDNQYLLKKNNEETIKKNEIFGEKIVKRKKSNPFKNILENQNFRKHLTFNDEYLSGKTFLLRFFFSLFVFHLILIIFFIPLIYFNSYFIPHPELGLGKKLILFEIFNLFITLVFLYNLLITVYKRCISLEWNKFSYYLTMFLMPIYFLCTPFMILGFINFCLFLYDKSGYLEYHNPIMLLSIVFPYILFTITPIFKLVFKNGNKYFKKENKEAFLKKINDVSNDILLDLILDNHLKYDELIDFKLSQEKKEYLNKKLNSKIDFVISQENN